MTIKKFTIRSIMDTLSTSVLWEWVFSSAGYVVNKTDRLFLQRICAF